MSLKTNLTNFSRYTLGFAGLAAVILVLTALFFGFAALVKFLFPVFAFLAFISIGIFLIVILPLSLACALRPRLAMISLVLSVVCGTSIWMYAFLVLVGYFGWLVLFLFFLFQSVVPIAAVALFVNGQWFNGLILLSGLGITVGMRFYSLWLDKTYFEQEEQEEDDDIIDVRAQVR